MHPFPFATVLLLAWGALAFGAEYAWAYVPLLVFSLVPAFLGLRQTRGALPARMLLVALLAVLLAGIVQALAPAHLVPGHIQTGTPDVDFPRLYALETMQPAPEAGGVARMSILPERTILGLAFLTAFTLLLAGCTRAISALGTRRLVRGIIVLGTVVAFVGVIHAAVRTEAVYGFWLPARPGVSFAPFLNENHFAGWMAMVISLAIGSFTGDVAVAQKNVAPGLRNRFLWFSSPRASKMMLTAFAVAVMALSMVITFSRGGLLGLLALSVIGSLWMLRRQSGLRRVIGGASLVAIVVFAAMWGDAGRTLVQFSGAFDSWAGRKEIWHDTWRTIQHYPLTGTGLNTFGIAMLHYQTTLPGAAVIEAHNDYLQLAAEGGLLLGVPMLLAIGLVVREVWRRFADAADDAETYWLRAGAVTGLCAIAVMEFFDFTLQMPGAAAMFVVLVAIAIHRPNYLRRESAPARAEGRRP